MTTPLKYARDSQRRMYAAYSALPSGWYCYCCEREVAPHVDGCPLALLTELVEAAVAWMKAEAAWERASTAAQWEAAEGPKRDALARVRAAIRGEKP